LKLKFSQTPTSDHPRSKPAIKILEAAQTVFLRDGGENFSARRVAKEAKVGLSTVQYFFRTTDALLIATLEHVDRIHEEIYRKMGSELPFAGIARLHAVLDYLINDLFEPETRRFYFGFWSLSCHNRNVEAFLTKSYENHRDTLAIYIGAARPHLPEKRCRDLATHIAALIEGLLVYVTVDRRSRSRRDYVRSIKKTIQILLDADFQETGGPSLPRRKQR
jgi:AcrR family transcriptional regulator